MKKWHAMSGRKAAEKLGSNIDAGLNVLEAARRFAETGPNEIKERGVKSSWRIMWEQLTSSMVVILLVAALLSLLLGESKDSIAILVIVGLNALLGFRQECKAEKAVAALKALAIPSVRVVREGSVQEISARELVPGDLVLLEAGNVIPADARLIESINLSIQEAALTGESQPVEKDAWSILEGDLTLADRCNMVYMGTAVTAGRAGAPSLPKPEWIRNWGALPGKSRSSKKSSHRFSES